jgi:outer membrane protein TolC
MCKQLILLASVLGAFVLRAGEAEPFSLPELQAFADEFSPELSRQRLAYSNLVESVLIAKTKYDPRFQIRRGWQETDDPERTTGTISQTLPADLDVRLTARNETRNDEDLTNLAVNLSKTLLGGGSFLESRLPVERAWIQEAREANTLSLDRRRLQLTVAQRYYAVVRNLLTLRLRELQLERARRNLEVAIAKEDPLDIATAELRIPESELDVLRVERFIEDSTLELAETIGLPVSQPLPVSTNLVYEVRPYSLEQDVDHALENHERILNARLSLKLNELEARVARSRNLPELRVEATYEEQEGAGDSTSEARADLIVEWPWLDRQDRAQTRQRLHDVRSAELGVFQAEQSVRKNIESVAAQLVEAEKSVELGRQRVKVLERQLILYQDRWENGEINILEYVRSQNDLENAKVQLVTQQARYMELRAEYDFLTGR